MSKGFIIVAQFEDVYMMSTLPQRVIKHFVQQLEKVFMRLPDRGTGIPRPLLLVTNLNTQTNIQNFFNTKLHFLLGKDLFKYYIFLFQNFEYCRQYFFTVFWIMH